MSKCEPPQQKKKKSMFSKFHMQRVLGSRQSPADFIESTDGGSYEKKDSSNTFQQESRKPPCSAFLSHDIVSGSFVAAKDKDVKERLR